MSASKADGMNTAVRPGKTSHVPFFYFAQTVGPHFGQVPIGIGEQQALEQVIRLDRYPHSAAPADVTAYTRSYELRRWRV